MSHPGTVLSDSSSWEFYTLRMRPVGSNIVMTKDGAVTGNVPSLSSYFGPTGFGFNAGEHIRGYVAVWKQGAQVSTCDKSILHLHPCPSNTCRTIASVGVIRLSDG